jgi:peptidoglycan/LPS O-acetylase OafA/YrhL
MRTQKLDALTGLRFLAAFAIVIHHLKGFGLPRDLMAYWPLDAGVSFFFVLSGFILTYVYPSLPTAADRNRFWAARFARIWPTHITALLLCYVLLEGDPSRYATGIDTPAKLAANVALVQAWIPFPGFFFGYNNVSWSISTEAFFYLAFPFLIARFARTWHLKLVVTLALAMSMVAISSLAGLPQMTSPDQGLTSTALTYIHPVGRIFEFTIGMCAAALLPKLREMQFSAVQVTAFEIAAIAILVVNTLLLGAAADWLIATLGLPFTAWVGQGGGLVLGFAGIILALSLQKGWISRLMSTRTAVWLGEISFMMYMIHYVVLRAYTHRKDAFADWSGPELLITYLAVIFVASAVLWRWVEVPARTYIMRAFEGRNRAGSR